MGSFTEEQYREYHEKLAQLTEEYEAAGLPPARAAESAKAIVDMEFHTRGIFQDRVTEMAQTEEYLALGLNAKVDAIMDKVDEVTEERIEEALRPLRTAILSAAEHVKTQYRKCIEEILSKDA